MKKAEFKVHVPASYRDNSFEEESDNSENSAPKTDREPRPFSELIGEDEGELGMRMMDEDQLRCHESIMPEENSTQVS